MIEGSVPSCEFGNERADTTIGDAKLKNNIMYKVESFHIFSMSSKRTVTGRVIDVDVIQISVPLQPRIP